MNNKLVLVLEKSNFNLSSEKVGDDVVLEGVFAQFGVVNNNDRIYEESEYLPHLEYLNKKIKENRLLGELDHPEKFDISLSKVSHVIEKLEYNKEKRQVVGRIRLMNTPQGNIARQLVESGVPISISSRAAGLVESNKKVRIKRIFTFDLVADPGFENAVLTKMNESLGILNENVAIYDVSSKYPELLEEFENKTKSQDMSNSEYVTSDEMNTYSLIIKEEMETMRSKMESLSSNKELNERIDSMGETLTKMEGYFNHITEVLKENAEAIQASTSKIEKIVEYTNHVSETVNESINAINDLQTKTDKHIQYSEYLKNEQENLIRYAEYLKECIEQGVSYAQYVGERTDMSIRYAEHIAKEANVNIKKTDKLQEQANALNEKLNDAVSYMDYVTENLNKGISYAEYIGEQTMQLSEYTEYMLNENASKPVLVKENETEKEETPTMDYTALGAKVDELIESTKKQKVDAANIALDEARKQKVSQAVNESSQRTADAELNRVMEGRMTMETSDLWLKEAPGQYKKLWESLDERTKNVITAQANYYKLVTPYQIKNFWETRNIQEPKLNESVEDSKPTALGYSDSYLNSVKKGLDRFGR